MKNELKLYDNPNLNIFCTIEELSKIPLNGKIVFEKKGLPYLEVYVYNQSSESFSDPIKVDSIFCKSQNGDNSVQLFDCEIQPFFSLYGEQKKIRIYFEYILSGYEKIMYSSDPEFDSVIFSFENLYQWTEYLHYKNEKKIFYEFNLDDIYGKRAKIKLVKSITTKKITHKDSRFITTKNETDIQINFIKGKINYSEIKKLSKDLQFLLTFLSGQSCFCLKITALIKNRPTKYYTFYDLVISDVICDPKFKVKHYTDCFFPFLFHNKNELKNILDCFFKNRNELIESIQKISAVFLFENNFLYDTQFHYTCTLVESVYKITNNETEYEFDRDDFRNMLKSKFDEKFLIDEILRATEYCLKGTYRKKLKHLINYQFDNFKLIKFSAAQINFIISNRDYLSHGESGTLFNEKDCFKILTKLNILLLNCILKKMGLTEKIVSKSLLSSRAVRYVCSENELIDFYNYKKITLTDNEFNKLQKLKKHDYPILELHRKKYYYDNKYTMFFKYDNFKLNCYRSLTDYIKCYYDLNMINDITYEKNIIFYNSTHTKKMYFCHYFLVNLECEKIQDSHKAVQSLIPFKVCNNGESILKQYRKNKKITLKKLSEDSGVSESTIKRYENNDRIPDMVIFKKIMHTLGTDLI